jgi:hypothetical protein
MLATFVHGKKWGVDKLVESLKTEFTDVSKALILRTIKETASKEKGVEGIGSFRWIVKPAVRTELELEVKFIIYIFYISSSDFTFFIYSFRISNIHRSSRKNALHLCPC